VSVAEPSPASETPPIPAAAPVPAIPEAPAPPLSDPAAASPVTPTEPAKPPEKQPHPESLGRSVGGHTTKIHAVCDALGLPIRFLLSGGEVHDSKMAQALIDGLAAEHLLADKGYDSRTLVAAAEAAGMTVLIPSRSNSLQPRTYDPVVYRERNQVERLFNRLKNCRRVATRYEKTARNYLAMVQLAGTMLWLA
jgi:transposase